MKPHYLIFLAFLLLSISYLVYVASASRYPVMVEILSLDFGNVTEVLKHVDNETEVYDGGLSSGDTGAEIANGVIVFYGNNTGASSTTGYDEPIAVIKFYNETNGFTHYARMPYNYSVTVSFMVPSSPGHGNFFVLPRYGSVANKYEIAIDFDYSNIVFNKVVDNSWQNIAIVPIGQPLESDTWYTLRVSVYWVYNSTIGDYTNKFHVELYSGSTLLKSVDFYDSSIPPSQYNGLAILGFTINNAFTVYADNLVVAANMTRLGVEPDETSVASWGGTDLDVTGLEALADNSSIVLRIPVAAAMEPGSDTKYWAVELDLDRDSRLGSWDYEYSIIASLDASGQAQANLFDSGGNFIANLHILGGGIGYGYLVVEVNKSLLVGLGNALYLAGHTQLGSTVSDYFPLDDTGNGLEADYYIWYLVTPSPASGWSTVTDPEGDAGSYPGYLDITSLGTAYDNDNVYFNVSVADTIPWYGGSSATYRTYIDADNDPGTGYAIGGIGADYLVEFRAGYSPVLYRYDTATQSFVFVAREDYLFNPGNDTLVSIIVPGTDFSDPPLGTEVSVIGVTMQNDNIADSTSELAVPIPEPRIAAMIAVVSAIIVLAYLLRRRSP